MEQWKDAFGSASRESDGLFAEVERIISNYIVPESVLGRVGDPMRTPAGLASYQFALYCALALGVLRGNANVRVLDAGAFVGAFTGTLRRLGFDACGIEIDPTLVEIAAGSGVELAAGDASRASDHFGERAFDLVTCINVIHPDVMEMDDAGIVALCSGLRDVLADDGLLVMNPPQGIEFPRAAIMSLGFERCRPEEIYCRRNFNVSPHLVLRCAGGV